MKAGYGRNKITPPLGVELCGYGYYLKRRATGIRDDLYASCLAFKSEKETYLLIYCDLVAFTENIVSETKRLIRAKYGVPEQCVMIAATHTHTGPATMDAKGCGEMDAGYIGALPEKILKAADGAYADLCDVEYIQSSEKEIAPIGYNRAIAGGPEDHFVRGFYIKRTGAPDIAVASYNCHPVSMGASSEISRDYAGQSADALKALGEAGPHGLFITGVCGDIDPPPADRGNFEKIKQYGKSIAKGFYAGLSPKKERPENFSHGEIRVPLPLQPFDEKKIKEVALAARTGGKSEGFSRVAELWEQKLLGELAEGNLNFEYEEGIAYVFSIGSISVVGINYETFTEIGTKIREAFFDRTVIVAGNAGSTKGYFSTPAEIETGGGYAARESMFLYGKLPLDAAAAGVFAGAVTEGVKNKMI
ncbi:MAG: hypothetical protein FWD23_12635 [Oscillospiraceae bacterium]|nr:hypothetical protein [Oscillospiraceae bacterium]